jgi:hypothetical protein
LPAWTDRLALACLLAACGEDTTQGTPRGIDDRVFPYTALTSSAYGADVVVYSVDDGERTGVWLARVD